MRTFKKVNVGLLVALVLLSAAVVYVVIATAVNYADEAEITRTLNSFAQTVGEIDSKVTGEEKSDVGDFDAALKDYYAQSGDSRAAAASHFGKETWDSVDYSKTSVSINFKSFTSCEVSVDLRDANYYTQLSMSLQMIKIDGKWKIERWSYGTNFWNDFYF